ncbi:SSU ribosomal protein S21p [Vibrio sp. JCM 18905]|nr:SSU ribosomal protein S21p [Vibrio sp. JCM 18905]
MPVVKVRENEPFDVALRRFKRSCEKAGILLKCVVVSTTKNQLQFANALKQQLKSVTLRS